MTFRSFGLRMRLETDSSVRLGELVRWLPPHKPCSDTAIDAVIRVSWSTDDPNDLRLTIDGKPPEDVGHLSGMHLFESLAKLLVAERSPHFVFVHAGVVGWRGRAIIIPAASFAGKTTLVSELIAAGADYYSDEYAVVDFEGLVHPFSRPLMVRQDGIRHWKEPAEYGAQQATEAIPAGMILSTRYDPAARWWPTEISAGRSVLKLLENTVSARRDPQRAMTFLRRLTSDACCWSGSRGPADETASMILAAFDHFTSLFERHYPCSRENERLTCTSKR